MTIDPNAERHLLQIISHEPDSDSEILIGLFDDGTLWEGTITSSYLKLQTKKGINWVYLEPKFSLCE